MENIKGYNIIQKLGNQKKRKFGKTFLAEQNQSRVIIKQFNKTTKKEHLFEQVKMEANFSFSMQGLPQVIDFFSNKNQSTLILKYKNGITIDKFWSKLKRKHRIPFLILLLKKLTPIFEILSQKKIVHCDIKPSNIIIEKTKIDFNVHLIDFGMAVQNNTPRKILFPLGYAAPELILNELSIIDNRTDQFSLGILLWRLFTGELPLSHPNPSIFTNLQITHPLPNHSKIPNKVFRVLEKMTNKHHFSLPPNRMNPLIVRQSLTKAMDERYNDLTEIINDLEKIKPLFYQIKSLR